MWSQFSSYQHDLIKRLVLLAVALKYQHHASSEWEPVPVSGPAREEAPTDLRSQTGLQGAPGNSGSWTEGYPTAAKAGSCPSYGSGKCGMGWVISYNFSCA